MYEACDSQSRAADQNDRVQRDSNKTLARVEQEGFGMNEQKDRLRQEREEIAARVASFQATQEKFEREREENFETTMENARKAGRPSFWP